MPLKRNNNFNKKYDKSISNSNKVEYFHLWWLLVQTRRALYKSRAKELSRYNLIPEKSTLLFMIQALGEKATQAEISRWVLREPHTISHLAQQMEKEGLVYKVKDLAKKNLVRVALTEKGKKMLRNSSKRESVYNIMSALSKEECQQLRSCLQKLRDKALNEIGAKIPKFPPMK